MRDVMKGLEAVLKEAGFQVDEYTPTTHSITLSATRGETRAVVHLTERVEMPYRAVALEQTPQASVLVKAGLPGMTQALATGQLPGISGAGAAPHLVHDPESTRTKKG